MVSFFISNINPLLKLKRKPSCRFSKKKNHLFFHTKSPRIAKNVKHQKLQPNQNAGIKDKTVSKYKEVKVFLLKTKIELRN